MKCYFILFFLLFARQSYAQSNYFEWVNPSNALRERLDIHTNQHLKEVKLGVWEPATKPFVKAGTFKDLPQIFSNDFFYVNNGKDIWFTIDGTGLVFQFTPATQTFLRLDHTFYRGYNFKATKFVRKNKLYSLGGNGFWTHSKNLTYFDVSLKEWEIFRTKNLGPESINVGYNGYSAKTDLIFAGASYTTSYLDDIKEVYDDRLFVFDFKKTSWTMLGHINPDLPFKKGWYTFWDGEHFMQFQQGKLFLIDPIANTIVVVNEKTQSFSPSENYNRFFLKGDTIYNYRENGYPAFKFSKKELLSKSKYMGPFYTKETPYFAFVIGFLFLISVLVIAYLYFKRKYKSFKKFETDFDTVELNLIQSLVALEIDHYLTNNDINDILGINYKSQDNQRKIKMNLINHINKKIENKFNITDAISRKNISDDNRLKAYFMKPEVVALFKK